MRLGQAHKYPFKNSPLAKYHTTQTNGKTKYYYLRCEKCLEQNHKTLIYSKFVVSKCAKCQFHDGNCTSEILLNDLRSNTINTHLQHKKKGR